MKYCQTSFGDMGDITECRTSNEEIRKQLGTRCGGTV